MNEDRTYEFYEEPDRYGVYLREETEIHSPLIIDRLNQHLYATPSGERSSDIFKGNPILICGIVGTVRLLSGRYLITINERELVGHFLGHKIYRAVRFAIYPFAKSTRHLSESQIAIEMEYKDMIYKVTQIQGFYFSYTYDLSRSQQSLSELAPEAKSQNIYDRANKKFLWNNFLIQDWTQLVSDAIKDSTPNAAPKLDSYLTPLICGFVGILSGPLSDIVGVEGHPSYAIISRRSILRAGTRFYARGVDSNGNAANTVETEQIAYLPPGHIFSLIQLRGSVPLFWSQRPNLRYKPSVRLGRSDAPMDLEVENQFHDVDPDQIAIMQRHFQDSCYLHHYGLNVAINLLDQTGMEQKLCRTFSLAAQAINQSELKYEPFDFHRECRSLQWHRLSILMDRLESIISALGFFRLSSVGPSLIAANVQQTQTGVFRTNCIDCLDRTNVVQSMIARRVLELGLQQSFLVPYSSGSHQSDFMERIWPGFESSFKALWADNADMLSLQYSGTRALKTDFTRTGKRTVKGMLMDGYHSIVRYYLNNFVDGYRQDAINLFLGHYSIFNEDGSPKPLPTSVGSSESGFRNKFFPLVCLFAASMSVLSLLYHNNTWNEKLIYSLFWGTVSVMSAFTVFTYGSDYVNKPRFLNE